MTGAGMNAEYGGDEVERYRGRLNRDPLTDGRSELRAFLCEAARLLIRFVKFRIDDARQATATVYELMKSLRVDLEIGLHLGNHPKTSAAPSPQEPDPVDNAVREVERAAENIREKGGVIGLPDGILQRQIEQAACEFPDDPELAAMGKKIAFEQLKDTTNLPSPPGIALKIMKLADDPNASIQQAVDVIKNDPAISARIMKYANSAFVGLQRPAKSVEEAVRPLGYRTLKSLILAFSLVSGSRKGGCPAFDYEEYWTECAARAATARYLFTLKRRSCDPDTAFAAGLLCQIGRLAFATAIPKEYAELLACAGSDDPKHLLSLEHHTLRIDHNELAGEMMAEWGLPEFFWQAVLYQSEPDNEQFLPPGTLERDLARALFLTELIWTAMKEPGKPINDAMKEAIKDRAEKIGIAREDCPEVYNTIIDHWKDLGVMIEVKTFPVEPWLEAVG